MGKEVIVHQSNITAFGWTGAGYAILDPVTGDAAWRISGVGNGGISLAFGYVAGLLFGTLLVMVASPAIFATPAGSGVAVAIMAALLITLSFWVIYSVTCANDINAYKGIKCFRSGLAMGLAMAALAGAFAAKIAAPFVAKIMAPFGVFMAWDSITYDDCMTIH